MIIVYTDRGEITHIHPDCHSQELADRYIAEGMPAILVNNSRVHPDTHYVKDDELVERPEAEIDVVQGRTDRQLSLRGVKSGSNLIIFDGEDHQQIIADGSDIEIDMDVGAYRITVENWPDRRFVCEVTAQ